MKKSHYSKKMFFRFLLGSTSKEENGVVLSELSKSKESLNSARKSFYGFLHIMSTPADKTWLDANFQKIDRRIKSKILFTRGWQVAAVLVGIITLGALTRFMGVFDSEPQWIIVSSNSAEQKSVLLPDGSKVQMAPRTTLKYPEKFTGDTRNVYVAGEAFFEVFKDKQHPFVVYAQQSMVEVLGTSFNIQAYADDATEQIMLYEGSVAFSLLNSDHGARESRQLAPGQKAVIDKNNNVYEIEQFNLAAKPAWVNGHFVMRDESFGDVARRLERCFDVEIIFNDSTLINDRLNGDFTDESVFEILDVIQILVPFKYQYNQSTNTITIEPHQN